MDEESILIVHDEESSRQYLANHLAERGHRVVGASDGAEALDLAGEIAPLLILLKVSLPGMDGFEVCRRLKADDKTKDIPVIFLTARAECIDKMAGLLAGGLDYLSTPLDDVELLARTTWALRMKKLQDELRAPTEQDALTGLLNRACFEERYHRESNRSRRYDSLFALVVVDIDCFRQINELHGLAFGDAVLKEMASVLLARTRESDYVARWGSNEFLLLLPEASLSKAIGFTKKLRSAIVAHNFGSTEKEIRLTLSVGVASRQNLGGRDPCELLGLAQECLRTAKEQGGDRIVYHSCGEFDTVHL